MDVSLRHYAIMSLWQVAGLFDLLVGLNLVADLNLIPAIKLDTAFRVLLGL